MKKPKFVVGKLYFPKQAEHSLKILGDIEVTDHIVIGEGRNWPSHYMAYVPCGRDLPCIDVDEIQKDVVIEKHLFRIKRLVVDTWEYVGPEETPMGLDKIKSLIDRSLRGD